MTASAMFGIGYAVVALVSLAAWRVHRRRPVVSGSSSAGGRFWLLTTALFAIMAVGRVARAASSATEFGRAIAKSEGWYDSRRPLQAMAIIAVAIVWIALVLALGSQSSRSGPSLAMMIVTTSLIMLGAVRTISLHHADAVLHRHGVGRLDVADALEVLGLVLALGLATLGATGARPRALATTDRI